MESFFFLLKVILKMIVGLTKCRHINSECQLYIS